MKRLLWLLVLLLFTMSFATLDQDVQAQNELAWTAEFFNNTNLSGNPTVTRQDNNIGFNWAQSAPNVGVQADNFSARWSTNTFFNDGTYRFYILADDGIRLFIDDVLLIDTYSSPRPGQLLSANFPMGSGVHRIRLEYVEFSGSAYLYFTFGDANSTSAPIFSTSSIQQTVVSNETWVGEYYNNTNLAGFSSAILTEPSPTHNWGSSRPIGSVNEDQFSVRWRSQQELEGTYRVEINADDGVRFSVNGVQYINEWHEATTNTYSATFTVPKGVHEVVVEYYENSGLAFLTYGLVKVNTTSPPPVPAPNQPPIVSNIGVWRAEYFNNPNFAGTPITLSEAEVTHNWRFGQPLGNLSPDRFSVRWVTLQNLTNGVYRFEIFADDGVRLRVDGNLVLDEWHEASNQVYTVDVPLTGGNHTIVVEYYENTGAAFIEYSMTRATEFIGNNTQDTNAFAEIEAFRLNIRSAPNAVNATILTKVEEGNVFPIIGKNADGTWWQLRIGDQIGWAFGRYLDIDNPQNVPVTNDDTAPQVAGTGYFLTSQATLNMRSINSTSGAVLGQIPRGARAEIVAQNADADWWYINYNGLVGWVSGRFVDTPTILPGRVPTR